MSPHSNSSRGHKLTTNPFTGQLLVTVLNDPTLYLINAEPTEEAISIATFPSPINSLLGISALTSNSDVYYVAAGNVGSGSSFTSGAIYSVDLSSYDKTQSAPIKLIASFPSDAFLNGVTNLNPYTLLVADTGLGKVYSLNVYTGKITTCIEDDSMKPAGPVPFGINGLRVQDSWLYYTNSANRASCACPSTVTAPRPATRR